MAVDSPGRVIVSLDDPTRSGMKAHDAPHGSCEAEIARLQEEIRRLREERRLFPDWKKEAEYFRAECDRLHAALAAHRAVARAAEDVVIEWRAGRTLDHLYQLSGALAHPLVQQAREEKT